MSVRSTVLAVAGLAAAGLLLRVHAESRSTVPGLAPTAPMQSAAPRFYAQAAPPQMQAPAPPPAAAQAPAQAPAPLPPSGPRVDESALRYFAAQGDTRRLEAEIARLKALYPDWVPPVNLGSPAALGDPELDRMWQLFGEGKYNEARTAIAERAGRDPNWQPPQELLDKLDGAEASRRLVNASDAKQWGTVLAIATQNGSLLTCENVDALWRVAEAYARTDRSDRALDAYRYVLTRCGNAGERLSTVQKASTLLADLELRELLKLERTGNDGKGEFESLRSELARTRLGKAALDPKMAVDPADLALLEKSARDGTSPDDALVVGYSYYTHSDPQRSLEWFKRAMERDGGARAAEGYALALIALDRFVEAEAAAYPWRAATPANQKAYLTAITAMLSQTPPPKLDTEIVSRAATAITDTRDPTAAQAMGWYAYNVGQIRTAASWFTLALRWQPDLEPAAFGLAVVRQRLRDRAGVAAIVAAWGSRSERIRDIGANRKPRSGVATPAVRQPISAPIDAVIEPPRAPAPMRPMGPAAGPKSSLPPAFAWASLAPAEPGTPSPPPSVPPTEAPGRLAQAVDPEATRPPRAGAPVVVPVPDPLGVTEGEDAVPEDRPVRRLRVSPARRAAPGCSVSLPALQVRDLSAGAALTRGWCLMGLRRPVEAAAAFEVAQQRGRGQTSSDATYGRTLALLAAGLTSEAAVAAAGGSLSPARRGELTASITTQRALAAYREGRYEDVLINLDERARVLPEQNDLLVLRGWSYFNLGRYGDAQQIFEAVSRTGTNDDANRGLNAIKQKLGRLPE